MNATDNSLQIRLFRGDFCRSLPIHQFCQALFVAIRPENNCWKDTAPQTGISMEKAWSPKATTGEFALQPRALTNPAPRA